MLPSAKDAVEGPPLVSKLALVYAWTNEPDLAFQELTISAKSPAGVHYGELKLDPAWDPLRCDPRFDNLLAHLAPLEIGAIDAERRITRQNLKGIPRSTIP
jgi:hypothetical protein